MESILAKHTLYKERYLEGDGDHQRPREAHADR